MKENIFPPNGLKRRPGQNICHHRCDRVAQEKRRQILNRNPEKPINRIRRADGAPRAATGRK